jgi:hypothetical protein
MSSTMALNFLFDINDQSAQALGKAPDPWAAVIEAGKANGYEFTRIDLIFALGLAERTDISPAKRELVELLNEKFKKKDGKPISQVFTCSRGHTKPTFGCPACIAAQAGEDAKGQP